ncbi:MAG: hypothetical protein AB8H03_23830 [Saprospiraceae bacterium]
MRKTTNLIFMIMVILFLIKIPTYALKFSSPIPFIIHNEIVGTFAFEQLSDDYLLLNTKVEKKHFVHALKKEGTCSAKDMMLVCGNQYLIDHFQVEVNGRKMILHSEDLIIEKDFVILTYTIKLLSPKVEEIKVIGDYMFKYNDHAILKVIFDINEERRNFSIKNRKRTIIAKF